MFPCLFAPPFLKLTKDLNFGSIFSISGFFSIATGSPIRLNSLVIQVILYEIKRVEFPIISMGYSLYKVGTISFNPRLVKCF